MTRTEILALAKQHGASAYTNRRYQDETYMTFSPEKLEAFFHVAQKLAVGDLAKTIHYPDCWDTAAYPTLHDALHEMVSPFDCNCDECAIRNRGTK